MTLRLNLEERHEEHTNEGTWHGKPKDRSVWLEGIMCVVAGGRRVIGNTCENCCADTEANRYREFCDCLENRAGGGLLRFGQRGKDIHLGRSELATLQEPAGEILTLATLKSISVPMITRTRAGKVNAQYESPERWIATRRKPKV